MEKNSKKFRFVAAICVFSLFLIFIFPFIIVIINSFKTTSEFISDALSLPTSLNLSNFKDAFEKMNFMHSFYNTLVITVLSTLFINLAASMTAHLFVRNKWKINRFMFFLMLASMIIPFQAIMIPLVKVYSSFDFFGIPVLKDIHMFNNMGSLIYMYVGFGLSMAVFIYHGFIKSIPVELEEAAVIDGCTRIQTFFKIVVPLLKNTTITVVILDVLWIWNDFLLPNLILLSPNLRTLQLSTYNFFGSYATDYGPLMAGLLMTMIPLLALFLFLQKHIITGVISGSIK